ncbi:unnamed protein product [Symbiodinium microadriaticum]|nr:unnamed protein product [Symbiodinium microadriaticum]
MFTYIEESDMVIDAFGGALGAEQSIFANSLCLSIRCTAPGAFIKQVESGMYRKEVDRDGSTARIFFKNLMLGEERDVLVTMELPAVQDEVEAFQMICTDVSYVPLGVDVNSPNRLVVAGGDCVVSRVSRGRLDPLATRSERVDVEINRMVLTRATEDAMAAADSSDYARARSTIETALETVNQSPSVASGNARAMAFQAELQATLDNVQNSEEYSRRGGRALMSEQAQNYGAQRCCYQKKARVTNVFHNASSEAYQSKASRSKVSNISR